MAYLGDLQNLWTMRWGFTKQMAELCKFVLLINNL